MYDSIEILRMAQSLASHASARQARIAANVANADTPNYHAQDVKSFRESYEGPPEQSGLRMTRANHQMSAPSGRMSVEQVDRPGPSDPNGNTVSIATEVMHATEVRHAHDMALAVYRSSLNILRSSLGRNS